MNGLFLCNRLFVSYCYVLLLSPTISHYVQMEFKLLYMNVFIHYNIVTNGGIIDVRLYL